MTMSGIKVISHHNLELLEKAVAEFIAAGNIVDDMKFSTAETQSGILYSVALMLAPQDSLLQI
ncbi:MAG TPA: hypothetical protein DEA44_17200 [Firmicutes bacterium]|nr:hypothetical protein [Bacillota bacterium]